MRIFVTGISSDIGQSIAKCLVSNGHDVVGLTRKNKFRIKGCLVVGGALEYPISYSEYLRGADLVIHAAGITHSDKTDRYFAVNVQAGARLIRLAEKYSVKRFIYISTRAIGPGCGAYGVSKRMLEERLQVSSLEWVILRVAEVYGVTKNEGINRLMKQVLRKKVILIPGDGEFMLTPIHVDDVSGAVCTVTDKATIRMKTYTLCGPKTYSINEFISVMCQMMGLDRVGILIPLFIIRLAVVLKRIFPLLFSVTKDQIQRLAVAKETTFSEAENDFGFSPMNFESWFQNEVEGNHDIKIGMRGKVGIRFFSGVIFFRGSADFEQRKCQG